MHVGGFPRASRPFQASRGLQGQGVEKRLAVYCQSLEPRLKFHAGWSGWTRPPNMAGGGGVGGVAGLRRVCKGE